MLMFASAIVAAATLAFAEPVCKDWTTGTIDQARTFASDRLGHPSELLWGNKCTPNIHNRGVLIGRKGPGGQFRVDWDPNKEFHVNVEPAKGMGGACYLPCSGPVGANNFAGLVDKLLAMESKTHAEHLPVDIRVAFTEIGNDCAHICCQLSQGDPTITCYHGLRLRRLGSPATDATSCAARKCTSDLDCKATKQCCSNDAAQTCVDCQCNNDGACPVGAYCCSDTKTCKPKKVLQPGDTTSVPIPRTSTLCEGCHLVKGGALGTTVFSAGKNCRADHDCANGAQCLVKNEYGQGACKCKPWGAQRGDQCIKDHRWCKFEPENPKYKKWWDSVDMKYECRSGKVEVSSSYDKVCEDYWWGALYSAYGSWVPGKCLKLHDNCDGKIGLATLCKPGLTCQQVSIWSKKATVMGYEAASLELNPVNGNNAQPCTLGWVCIAADVLAALVTAFGGGVADAFAPLGEAIADTAVEMAPRAIGEFIEDAKFVPIEA